jgi:ABC-type uncharacterized transport system substrate-binding protein
MIQQRPTWMTVLLVLVLLAAPAAARAQPAERAARIAWLSATGHNPTVVKEFEDALREAGWVPGRTIMIDYRAADGQYDRLAPLVAELLQLNPQVILTSQTPATQAARRATDTIPIVMVGNGDPVRYGLVRSLARPEANVTGTGFLVNEVGIKLLELLKEAVPRTARVAVFINPANPGAAPLLEDARAAAPRLGLAIRPAEVSTTAELDRMLDALLKERVDAFWLGPEAFLLANRRRILEFAIANRLPAVGPHPTYPESGALMSYSPHIPSLMRASARYVDKLLKGAKPADLPIEQPSRFELVINARTARALGLALPPAFLGRADRVID